MLEEMLQHLLAENASLKARVAQGSTAGVFANSPLGEANEEVRHFGTEGRSLNLVNLETTKEVLVDMLGDTRTYSDKIHDKIIPTDVLYEPEMEPRRTLADRISEQSGKAIQAMH